MNIDQIFLKNHFRYSEILKGLYWIKATSKYANPKIGEEHRAGATDSIGYRVVSIYGKSYKEHRLVWIYHNGDISEGMQIDHVNRIKNDNRIENLRLATSSSNGLNTNAKNYTYRINNKNNPYEARYEHMDKTYSKSFPSKEQAENWVIANKKKIIEDTP